MSNKNLDPLTQDPTERLVNPPSPDEPQPVEEPTTGKFRQWWAGLQKMGASEVITSAGSHVFTILMVLVIVFALGRFYVTNVRPSSDADNTTASDGISGSNGSGQNGDALVRDVILPEYIIPDPGENWAAGGVYRDAEPETIIPSRSRTEVTLYTVQLGDNLFSIADQFGLTPETILWGNYDTLKDNPAVIHPGQVLNILPVDGVYYRYNAGESLSSIAISLRTDVVKIIDYPGNGLDPYDTNPDDPGIPDGTMLIVPDGWRELADWGPPAISRTNPASAAYYGSGSCGEIYEGPIGNGTFIWPTPATYLSGYHYTPSIHEAIDIGGAEGNAIWAVDTGVVVYAGWSEYGYGNLLVIDHGNGWQSAYAHLQYIYVSCGEAVYQGATVASLGNTGNSSGAHLHLELRNASFGRVNPMDYLVP